MNTTLQIRIDKKTKEKAKKIFSNLGLDMSSGVNLFLSQVVNTESIPFEPRTENGFTIRKEMEIIKETKHALKYGKRYTNVNKMFKDLLK